MKNFTILLVLLQVWVTGGLAQVSVNDDSSSPDPSAMLDVKSATKGVLFPRVSLTGINDPAPVTAPAPGLMVYNTVVAGIAPNNVTVGYYRWDGSKWQAVSGPPGINAGDMQYWNGVQWISLPAGSNGQILTLNNGVPTWGGIQLPAVITLPVSGLSSTLAIAGGQVVLDGGGVVTTRGVCWSTSPMPTIANDHSDDGSGTGNFESNLFILLPNTIYHTRAYATNIMGTAYGNEVIFTTMSSCGTIPVNHVAGTYAPVSKTVTYGTVANVPGEPAKCWITSNLGADHQATAVNDATENSAGWYWQFNRKQGFKHDGTTRTPGTTWITSITETSDWSAANDPCTHELGAGWRIPTRTEWVNVDAAGGWTTWIGPWNSGLKLHAAGYLSNSSGTLYNRSAFGYYWSSFQLNSLEGWYLNSGPGSSGLYVNYKSYGFSLRCLKNF